MLLKYIASVVFIYSASILFFDLKGENQETTTLYRTGFCLEKGTDITGVGDIMLGTSFPSSRYLPPHDNPFFLLGSIMDTLRTSDITFGNLEGSFLNNGEP